MVSGVMEHPKRKALTLVLADGRHVRWDGKGTWKVAPKEITHGEFLDQGWKDLPVSPPQGSSASSSPLNKIIEAAAR